MKRTIRIVFICLTAILSFSSIIQAKEPPSYKVLILHSYHHGFQWTDNIMEGIDSVFTGSGLNLQMHVEYMDTKLHDPKDFFTLLYELYKKRYEAERIDLIIISDNNALDFLLKYRNELFPDVPVVFCGINNFTYEMIQGHTGFTGVTEELSIQETINLALHFNPEIRQIAVVNDTTPTGVYNQKTFERKALAFRDSVTFESFIDLTFEELQEKLKLLPSDSAVLLFTFFRDREGRPSSRKEFVPVVSSSASVPTYSFWEQQMGLGVTGGVVVDGTVHGARAAEIALKILNGESPGNIPVLEKSPNTVTLDYTQLKRFGIDESLIPSGATILNKPRSLYEDNKRVIWMMTGGTLTLFLFVLLLFRIRGQRKIAAINVQLSKEVDERRLSEMSLKKSTDLLRSIKDVQNVFISSHNHEQVFDALLGTLVSMSESEYGFLDEVLQDESGRWYKRSLSLSNIAWDEASSKLFEELRKSNLEFHNLNNLAGEPVKTGKLVIANDPCHDPRSGGLSHGHPAINAYMGIPLYFGKELVGVAGVANRKGGYTEDSAAALEPFIATCAGIISAIRSERSEENYLNVIKASLEEKEVLLREVHHRVKNNFQIINSLLRLQAENIDEAALKPVFVDVENRIRSMAMVHEMLYSEGDLSQIDIGGYIHALTQGLFRSYRVTSDKVKIRTEIEGVKMGIDAAVPFGLVVNELVSNAMKHAFPGSMRGEITISLQRSDAGKGYELVVSDNGVGLPEGLDVRNSGTLGLRLIVNIVEKQIGGTVEVRRGRGTEFRIRISLNDKGELGRQQEVTSKQ